MQYEDSRKKAEAHGDGTLRYNDPVYHRSVFFCALDNAVKSGDISVWKADEMKRDYNNDVKED